MKNILFLFIMIPFISFSQNSSNDVKGKWGIGINGGVNVTNASGLKDEDISSKIGRLYGFTIMHYLTNNFAVKADIDYETKGWVFNNYDIISNNSSQENLKKLKIIQQLEYLDVPIFLHFGFGNKLKYDLNIGPYIAVLINSEASYKDENGAEQTLKDDTFNDYSSLDYGLVYGAGIDYQLSEKFSLGFDVLYEHGMKAIKGDLKNQSIDFDFGINILI